MPEGAGRPGMDVHEPRAYLHVTVDGLMETHTCTCRTCGATETAIMAKMIKQFFDNRQTLQCQQGHDLVFSEGQEAVYCRRCGAMLDEIQDRHLPRT